MENRKYKVGEIFIIKGSKAINKDKAIAGDHSKFFNTPYICRGKSNNGCEGFFNFTPTQKANCVTIGSQGARAFYQYKDFFTGTGVLILQHKNLTENIGLYLCTAINKELDGYGYGYEISQEKLKDINISLPSIIHDDGTYEPDWEYMENYIANLRKKINIYTQDSIKIIENAKNHRGEKIDTSDWREYKNRDIFIMRGIKQSTRKADNIHKYASISQSSENNGASGWDSTFTESGGFISMEDNICGKCFYQNLPIFVSSSAGHVHWINLKNTKLTENIGLFLITILNQKCYIYNRGHKRNQKVFMEEDISLPSIIHEDGTYEPDWEYMEDYIEKLKTTK